MNVTQVNMSYSRTVPSNRTARFSSTHQDHLNRLLANYQRNAELLNGQIAAQEKRIDTILASEIIPAIQGIVGNLDAPKQDALKQTLETLLKTHFGPQLQRRQLQETERQIKDIESQLEQ